MFAGLYGNLYLTHLDLSARVLLFGNVRPTHWQCVSKSAAMSVIVTGSECPSHMQCACYSPAVSVLATSYVQYVLVTSDERASQWHARTSTKLGEEKLTIYTSIHCNNLRL